MGRVNQLIIPPRKERVMRRNCLPTEAARDAELMRNLRNTGFVNNVPEQFIRSWTSTALSCMRSRDQRAIQALRFYYGLYRDLEPQILVPIARWLNLSISYTCVLKNHAIYWLAHELARLYKVHGQSKAA